MRNQDRCFKLGMHSYTLNLFGCGETYGVGAENHEKVMSIEDMITFAAEEGIEVLHITLLDLDNNLSEDNLLKVKKFAEENGVELELNISFDAPYDKRINATAEEAMNIAHTLGCRLVKFSLDIVRPRILSHSCMCPEVMVQLTERYNEIKKVIPLIEKYNLLVALENHTDTFADEVIWLIEKLSHPNIGACMDTVNSLIVMEGIEECIRKMVPYAYNVHFCDNEIVYDIDGTRSAGATIGQGQLDCVKIMQIIREQAPPQLDVIDFEIEMPLSKNRIEDGGRERQKQAIRDSIKYMRNVLKVGK